MSRSYPDLPEGDRTLDQLLTGAEPCVQFPDLWFPLQAGGAADVKEARKWCARCPITAACADFAVRWDIPEGVWGGTTPKQRDQIRAGQAAERAA